MQSEGLAMHDHAEDASRSGDEAVLISYIS
jgi:hypothetical protein